MAIKSNYALLDVTKGRASLVKRLDKGSRIPVVVRGFVTDVWGSDDGISQEFLLEVSGVQELKRAPAKRAR